jgi:hypothetical protein
VWFAVKTSAVPPRLEIFLMTQTTVETVGYFRSPLPWFDGLAVEFFPAALHAFAYVSHRH